MVKSAVNSGNLNNDLIIYKYYLPSGKPGSVYSFIDQNVINSLIKIELFARNNNTRNNWISVGNELSRGSEIISIGLDKKDLENDFKIC